MASCKDISCLSTYSCDSNIITLQEKRIYGDGAVYMPYVELNFGENKITLGNQSSPPVNHAAIASFQYGMTAKTPGTGVEIEIIDHAGTMYPQIVSALNKTVSRTLKDSQFSFDFGWVIKKCDGTTKKILFSEIHGYKPKFMAMEATPIIEGNNVRLKLSLNHVGGRWAEAPLRTNAIATEDAKITLKEAIIKIFKECDPKFKDVKFRNKEGNEKFYFKNDKDGPKAAWEVKKENSLEAVRRWLNDQRSSNDHGFILYYDPNIEAIIVQEDDPEIVCGKAYLNRGAFIVNGGKCSPVIKFTPEFRWSLVGSAGVGGASAGAASGQNNKEVGEDPNNSNIQKAGTSSRPITANMNWQWVMPEFATEEMLKGFRANIESNSLYELPGVGVVEATLEIIGNPSFGDPFNESGYGSVSIILINPFRMENKNNKCGWAISNTNCNPIVSNKSYLIKGVSHSISSGSFVTTLQLTMIGPNIQKPADAPLGGEGPKFNDQEIGKTEAADSETGC